MKMNFLYIALLACGLSVAEGGKPRGINDVWKWGCPPGVPIAMCFSDPCLFATCAVPGAKCRPNYCGGCFADWFDIDGNVVPECSNSPA